MSSAPKPAGSAILDGPLPIEVMRFGAPIAIGMGLQVTFNLVDAYVISRLEPAVAGPALGALGICDQISAIGTILSYGLTTASSAMISQAQGRGDRAEVRRLVWQSILAVGALSLIIGVVSIAFAGPIMHQVVGAKGRVATLGVEYLRVNSGGSFAIFFLLQLTAIQRALGSSKTPVALLLASNALNLVLAVLFVYGAGPAPPVFAWASPIAAALHIPRLELLGAAWATVLARTLVLVPCAVILVRRFDVYDAAAPKGPDPRILRAIWSVGWPSSIQFVVRMVAMLITHSIVARVFTTPEDQTPTTALGIVLRLETMALFVAMGWGSAAQTFVGQCLGAGKAERAVRSGWYAALYNAAFMLAILAAYHAYAAPIIAFFDADPRVVAVAVGYVSIVAYGYIGLGTGVVLGSAINGAGATRITLFTDLGVVLGFQLPACALAVLLPHPSLTRLWASVLATYLVSGVAYVIVFRVADWIRAGIRSSSVEST